MTNEEKILGLDESAENITRVMDMWEDGWDATSENPANVSVRAARRQSDEPIFNLAAWLKYNFGDVLTGEENSDWLRHAESIAAILGVGPQTADAVLGNPTYTPEQSEAIYALADTLWSKGNALDSTVVLSLAEELFAIADNVDLRNPLR